MTEVRPFKISDLFEMPPLLGCYEGDFDLPYKIATISRVPGVEVATVVADQRPIAVIGVTISDKVGSLWAAASEAVSKYAIGYHKALLKEIARVVEKYDLVRIQSMINADNEKALKQHLSMGFEIEGRLRRSSPLGKDELLLARIF